VNKLRQVLGDSPDEPTYVETIPRKGYSFVAESNSPTRCRIRPRKSRQPTLLRDSQVRSLPPDSGFSCGTILQVASCWSRRAGAQRRALRRRDHAVFSSRPLGRRGAFSSPRHKILRNRRAIRSYCVQVA